MRGAARKGRPVSRGVAVSNFRQSGITRKSTESGGVHTPHVAVDGQFQQITPDTQASTNAYSAVVGSEIDTAVWRSLSFTILVADASVDWKVLAANRADHADAVAVKAEASVAAAGSDSYSVAQAPYRYYWVEIKSTVGDTPGNAVVAGIAKN